MISAIKWILRCTLRDINGSNFNNSSNGCSLNVIIIIVMSNKVKPLKRTYCITCMLNLGKCNNPIFHLRTNMISMVVSTCRSN